MNTKIPPPIVAITFAILMWQLDSLLPMGHLSLPGFAIFSSLLGVLGIVVMGLAISRFRKVSTTVDPRDPSLASSLVSGGIFGRSRNPMYVGMLFLLTAWAIWLGNGANVVLIYLFFSFMTRFQIKPEEQALTKLFGQEYEDYCKKVNRWF
jgi:protein-S-isoprenylcysteine O-methyltransferase Ste14